MANGDETTNDMFLEPTIKLWPKPYLDGNLWISPAAGCLYEQYRELRQDLCKNATTWNYAEYCERIAFHYYNIASFYNDLFRQHGADLGSVRKWLEKCLEKIGEETTIESATNLKRDAQQCLVEINQLFQKIVSQTDTTRKQILLGLDADSSTMNTYTQQELCQLQGIRVLKVINNLEDELSLPEQKHIVTTMNHCSCLAEMYTVANRPDLSKYYIEAMQNYMDKFENVVSPISFDERVDMDKTIACEVEEYKSTVKQIVLYLEENYCKQLSSYDVAYIEKKYLNTCTEFWQTEVSDYLKKIIDEKNADAIQNIFNTIDSTKNLSTIPRIFLNSDYLNLLKLLKLSENDEKNLVQKFKLQCWNCLFEFSSKAKVELRFIENFIDFLSFTHKLENAIFVLELKAFLRDEITLQNLLGSVLSLDAETYGEELSTLKETAQCFVQPYDMFLLDKFKHVVSGFLEPAVLEIKKLDGRLVAEVTGKIILISKIKHDLEEKLRINSNIEEVRFVGAHVLHIDANFGDAIWKGKNIVVLAKTIKFYNNATWDVSGKDNDHKYTEKAVAEKDGTDGFAGESGGNVLILAKRFDNAVSFTVLSNGGMGSPGQDGGDGKDGADGKGIEKHVLEAKFKSLVGSSSFRDQFLENIKQACSDPPFIWESKYEGFYIEALTREGNKIFFSYCCSKLLRLTGLQNYIICKGSLGKSGTQAGKGGLGGEGGLCGQIEIVNYEDGNSCFDIAYKVETGQDGQNGQGGLSGKHGKNGWDMAYIDYELWGNPTYYGEDCKSTCTAACYAEIASDRVVCPYNDGKYVGITVSRLEHPSQERFRNANTKKPQERQHHARAVSKKTITKSNILSNYTQQLDCSVESTLQSLHSTVDYTKQRALEAILENEEQQSKINTDIKVERNYQYKKLKTRLGKIEPLNNNDKVLDFKKLMQKLTKSETIDEWADLEEVELSFDQLQNLFPTFRQLQSNNNTDTEAVEDIEDLLMDKCRYSALQEIASQLITKKTNTDGVSISANDAAKYLVEGSIDSTRITHPTLGMLEDYFKKNQKEQHDNIVNFARNELENGKSKIMMHSIRRFLEDTVLEMNAIIEMPYIDYKTWMDESTQSKEKYLTQFVNEISKPEHANSFELWLRSIRNTSLKSKFENLIDQNDDLREFYKIYITKCEELYDCERFLCDESFIQVFFNSLNEKELSGCYRELLAYAFNVNIRFYKEIQEEEYELFSDHNPLASQAVYFLSKDDESVPLIVDGNFLELDEQRINEGDQFATILTKVELLDDEKQVFQYLIEKTFLTHTHQLSFGKVMKQEVIDEYIERIIVHFPEEEQYLLKKRLCKVVSAYEGRGEQILNKLFDRFVCEGRHISCQEMCCILNQILKSSVTESMEGNHFVWIFAAYRQREWIAEVLLLQLEVYFRRQNKNISVWREYLQKINQRNVIVWLSIKLTLKKSNTLVTEQLVENILKLLSEIPNEAVNVLELNLSEWIYVLKEKYWTNKLSQVIDCNTQFEELSVCSYYVNSIENIYGQSLVEKLFNVNLIKKFSVLEMIEVLKKFYSEEWILSDCVLNGMNCYDVPTKWIKSMKKQFATTNENRSIAQLLKLIKCNKKVSNNLQKIEETVKTIRYRSEMLIKEIQNSNLNESLKDCIKKWSQQLNIKKHKHLDNDELVDVISVIITAIQIQKGITLRDTQLLTILTMLTSNKSTLAQVSTGEGKSLIVVSVAIVKAVLKEEKIDIITSSSVLAKRDAEANRDVFNLFGINVSHNCSEDIEKRRMTYSGNAVVYGDLASFQRDYLLDRFCQKKILGDRNFENIIVDEVDSMLLDKGNNMLYLSHDLADFDKLESVYIFIWEWINRPARDIEDLMYAFDADAIKEAIIWNINGTIKPDDIEKLDSKLGNADKRIIWKRLVEADIVDYNGKLCVKKVDTKVINDKLEPEFSAYADRVCFLIQECIEREKQVHIPNHLVSFVEQHLDSWIMSAQTAFYMRPGQDYVVDVDRSGTRAELNPNIIILDRDTGTDQASSQWEAALHQFLQLKHGCKLSMQSLKAVFISNVSYLKLYEYLYGLTGTLGSQRERSLLEEIYKVDFVTIPTAKCKLFSEISPILCKSQSDWMNRIVEETVKQIEEKGRSVLIICETVNDVESLHTAFGGKTVSNIFTYTRDYEEFDNGTDENKLDSGKIIIATNLAGRGTDVKITEKLRNAGGLHVCLSFLPSNIRIEQQAFGRAARCGDRGSGQLILLDSQGQQYNNSRVIEIKKQRDAEELQRIADVKVFYETKICVEEEFFHVFKQCYDQLKKKLTDALREQTVVNVVVDVLTINTQSLTLKDKAELEEILLHSCLDKWVFWLDKHNIQIGKENNKLSSSLKDFVKQLMQLKCNEMKDFSKWVEGNPSQTIKLGKFLLKNNESEMAKQLFDKAIEQEPHFSEAAHYYKAYALAKKGLDSQSEKKSFKHELSEASRLFGERQNNSIHAGSIIGNIKKANLAGVLQIEAFEEQQKSFCGIYQSFIQSIDEIMNDEITPQTLMNDEISEEAAEKLIYKLIQKGVLKGTRFSKSIDLDKLRPIAASYGIPLNSLRSFLSEHKGSAIDLNNFANELRKQIPLAGRERFWKALIQQGALTDEVMYVFVEQDAFSKIERSKRNKLKTVHVSIDNNDLVLYPEHLEEQKKCSNIFQRREFKNIVGRSSYDTMEKKGTITINKKASLRAINEKPVFFEHFDSLKREDFSHIGITDSEGSIILTQLIEAKIIKEKNAQSDIFVADEQFHSFKQLKLPSCPVYEDAVIALISTTFTYRIALKAIVDEAQTCQIKLQVRPQQSLVAEFLEHKIVKPVTAVYNCDNTENIVKDVLNESEIPSKKVTQHVLDTLDRCKGSLRALKVPESQLLSLAEFLGDGQFSNAEELYIFSINGLDQLLKLGEKKWTWEMIRNTIIVIALGVGQIALGAVIELYSVGLMTHVGGACISEGINDIFFAAGALKSGYFSWKEYRQQKLQSLKMTILSAGIGAYVARGTKVSRYGYKLAGPHLQATGKNIAATCGEELIKEVGRGVIKKEVTKRIVMKTVQGIAFGMANASVDYLIENHLRTLCSELAAKFLEVIETPEKYQSIAASLNEIYKKLGPQEAKEVVAVVTKQVFTGQSTIWEITSWLRSFAGGVIQGLAAAVKKCSMANNRLDLPLQKIGMVMSCIEYAEHIIKIGTLTDETLSQLNFKLSNELKKRAGKENRAASENNTFTNEAIATWKQQLRQQVEQIIEQNFVAPVLKQGVNCLVTYAGKKIQQTYQSFKENKYTKCFEELKQQHKEEVEKISNRDDAAQAAGHLKEQYHKDLLKLMKKTCNPRLFADIIRENVPMDITCVGACSKVITKILKSKGVLNPVFTIVVETADGLRQEFSSIPNGERGVIIPLSLEDGHFQSLDGPNTDATNNNCLCTAVLDCFNIEDVTPEQFRDQIANTVQSDPQIRDHIQRGWHRFPLSRGAFGGYRQRRIKTDLVEYSESYSHEEVPSEKDHQQYVVMNGKVSSKKENQSKPKKIERPVKKPHKHIIRRKPALIELVAIEAAISEFTKIPINELTEPGPCKPQDQSSGLGHQGIDAAHLVAPPLGNNSEKLKKFKLADKIYANKKGHTHNVLKEFNREGIARSIDNTHREYLPILRQIDFKSGTLSSEDYNRLLNYDNQFMKSLEDTKNEARSEIELVKKGTKLCTPEKMYEIGHKTYIKTLNRLKAQKDHYGIVGNYKSSDKL